MSEELKPCPFCGQPASVGKNTQVWCKNVLCATVVSANADTWNQRPIEDALRAELVQAQADAESERRWADLYHGHVQYAEERATKAEAELEATHAAALRDAALAVAMREERDRLRKALEKIARTTGRNGHTATNIVEFARAALTPPTG